MEIVADGILQRMKVCNGWEVTANGFFYSEYCTGCKLRRILQRMIEFYSGWNCAGKYFCFGRNFAFSRDGILRRMEFCSRWNFAAD